MDRSLVGVEELILFISITGGFERYLQCVDWGSVSTRGITKTDFKCMGRTLFSKNAFLGGVYRFGERVLWGTFLRVLRLCTLFMTGRDESLSPVALSVENNTFTPFALCVVWRTSVQHEPIPPVSHVLVKNAERFPIEQTCSGVYAGLRMAENSKPPA